MQGLQSDTTASPYSTRHSKLRIEQIVGFRPSWIDSAAACVHAHSQVELKVYPNQHLVHCHPQSRSTFASCTNDQHVKFENEPSTFLQLTHEQSARQIHLS
jgi:hypothetical protein